MLARYADLGSFPRVQSRCCLWPERAEEAGERTKPGRAITAMIMTRGNRHASARMQHPLQRVPGRLMGRRPSAGHPGRGSWEGSYPDAPYRDGWQRDGLGDDRDRAVGAYRQHAVEAHRGGAATGYRATRHRRDTTGSAAGNERLTALTGMVLLVLLAAEGVTVLSVQQLLTVHFFVGMLLIGPVVLKVCSTGYRFVRYYTGAAAYRRKGPPAPLLRLLGPVVLLTSVAVIGTGVMLALTGPGGGVWLLLHKASFVLWFGAMTVHVLAYIWRLPRLARGDVAGGAGRRANEVLAGRGARWLLLMASVLTGLLLAVLTVHQAGAWTGLPGLGH